MTTTTAPTAAELATSVLESAYLAMAQGRTLNDDQQIALEIAAPDQSTIEKNVARCERIPGLQEQAGTSADRDAAKKALAEMETELPAQVEELRRAIQKKEREIARLERAKREQHSLIQRQEAAVDALRDSVVPPFIKQRFLVRMQSTRPLRERRKVIRRRLGDLDRLHELKPGEADFTLTYLNEVLDEQYDFDETLVRYVGRELNNGANSLDHEVDAGVLDHAKKATAKVRDELRAEYDHVVSEIDRIASEAQSVLDFYLPE